MAICMRVSRLEEVSHHGSHTTKYSNYPHTLDGSRVNDHIDFPIPVLFCHSVGNLDLFMRTLMEDSFLGGFLEGIYLYSVDCQSNCHSKTQQRRQDIGRELIIMSSTSRGLENTYS
jgi:hypothetical protein